MVVMIVFFQAVLLSCGWNFLSSGLKFTDSWTNLWICGGSFLVHGWNLLISCSKFTFSHGWNLLICGSIRPTFSAVLSACEWYVLFQDKEKRRRTSRILKGLSKKKQFAPSPVDRIGGAIWSFRSFFRAKMMPSEQMIFSLFQDELKMASSAPKVKTLQNEMDKISTEQHLRPSRWGRLGFPTLFPRKNDAHSAHDTFPVSRRTEMA